MRAPRATRLVCAFQYQADAERFYRALGQRLGNFELELSPDKTRVIPFTRQQVPGQTSFDCLGFECRWGRDRAGMPHLKRRTSRQKRRNSLKRATEWGKEKCRDRLNDLFREVNAKLRGYYHYDGVNGNSASLQEFFTGCTRSSIWSTRSSRSCGLPSPCACCCPSLSRRRLTSSWRTAGPPSGRATSFIQSPRSRTSAHGSSSSPRHRRLTQEPRGEWEERRTKAPRTCDRWLDCGAVLPAWLPVANQPGGAQMRLPHLSQRHPDQVRPLLERMRTADIATVAAEAFEIVE